MTVYLSATFEKANPDVNFSLETVRKDNLNKLVFARLNINSIQNKFDSLDGIRTQIRQFLSR